MALKTIPNETADFTGGKAQADTVPAVRLSLSYTRQIRSMLLHITVSSAAIGMALLATVVLTGAAWLEADMVLGVLAAFFAANTFWLFIYVKSACNVLFDANYIDRHRCVQSQQQLAEQQVKRINDLMSSCREAAGGGRGAGVKRAQSPSASIHRIIPHKGSIN